MISKYANSYNRKFIVHVFIVLFTVYILCLGLDLSNNWQTSHREYHANKDQEMLLGTITFYVCMYVCMYWQCSDFRWGLNVSTVMLLTVSSCRLFHTGIVFTKNECLTTVVFVPMFMNLYG